MPSARKDTVHWFRVGVRTEILRASLSQNWVILHALNGTSTVHCTYITNFVLFITGTIYSTSTEEEKQKQLKNMKIRRGANKLKVPYLVAK
jgi:hypothetical protein